MTHKIRIYNKYTDEEVTAQDYFFIGTDGRVYRMDDCDCVTIDRDLYWKFDMIEVKE
jgi:hypothetical protein